MSVPNEFSGSFGRMVDLDIAGPALGIYRLMPDIAGDALAPAYWPEGDAMRPYRFDVGYTADGRFNAAARDAGQGHGLVAFCFGAPFILFHACLQAAKRVDTGTALPVQDRNGRMILQPEKITLAPIGVSRNAPSGEIVRRCNELLDGNCVAAPAREEMALALLLYEIGARFLCMHECMHIVLGHTAYVRDTFGMAILPEFFHRSRRLIAPALSQTLEFIADRHAARGVLAHYLHRQSSEGIGSEVIRLAKVPPDIYMVRLVTTAMVVLMHLLPVRAESMTDRGPSHPHPYLRARWICREMNIDLDEGVAQEGVARLFTHWMVALASNFLVKENWLSANTLDSESARMGKSLSDAAYSQIVASARYWQTRLWRDHSPVYENDGSDRYRS